MKDDSRQAQELESGDKYVLEVPGLDYGIPLPLVELTNGGRRLRIASLNLVGCIRLNHDLGRMLAARIREHLADPEGVVILTAVEKALQLVQVVARELGVGAVAVAYNRVKPHMQPERRPLAQIGSGSITSGEKTLVMYERDIRLLATARRGIVIVDDVVSTGETVRGLLRLVAQAAERGGFAEPPLLGVFCAACEGTPPALGVPVVHLAELPPPEVLAD